MQKGRGVKTHFPTVPVEAARQMAHLEGPECLRPVVLVVDDEPIITETLATILNGSGLAAITAPNARVALEIVSVIPPQLLITDYAMPGMNGIELACRVAKSVHDCEVIVFSGHASPLEISTELREAGHRFITLAKPVHPADLLEKAFEALGRRGALISLPRPRPKPSLYDFLSSRRTAYNPDAVPFQVKMRQRLRPGASNPADLPN
jgi:CheY-like chemotaxis protein